MSKPVVLTIFGASGDLTRLKIFPGIYALAAQGKLPEKFTLVGFARSKFSNEEFREYLRESARVEHGDSVQNEILDTILENTYYFAGQYDQLDSFKTFREFLSNTIGEKVEDATHVAHLSVPPNVFKDIIVNLSDIRDTHDEDIRLVVEKPFGYDESSAEQLYHVLGSNFSEDQVFLLDHYLGKNTMQSIFELRKSNRILSTILRGQEISNIQITIHENYGADQRLGYFEQVGIIRDMVQSHMFQMLALVTMSIPVSDSARQIRIEKDTILSALRFYPDKSNIVIGQYESYAGQKDTDPHTQATTYAALRLFIDRQDWYKVPIYLRVGKKLDTTKTTIIVEFEKFAFQNENDPPNRLVFHMKPTQEVEVQFVDASHSEESKMVLGKSLACMDDVCLNEHGQLLYEVMQNNQKNFVSFEEIIASWRIVDSIIEFIAKEKIPPSLYKDNSQGPEGYEQLPNQDNFSWYDA